MGCGYLFPGLLHSKALKAVSGGRSAAAAAPRRPDAPLGAGPPEPGARGRRGPAAAEAAAGATDPGAWRVVATRAPQ